MDVAIFTIRNSPACVHGIGLTDLFVFGVCECVRACAFMRVRACFSVLNQAFRKPHFTQNG